MSQTQSSKWKKFLEIFRYVDILATPYEFNVLEGSQSLTVIDSYNTNLIYAGTQGQSEAEFSLNSNNLVFALQFQTQEGEVMQLSDVQGYDYSIKRYLILDVNLVQGIRYPGQFGLNQTSTQLEVQNCSQKVIDRLNFQSQAFNQMELDYLSCFKGDYKLFGQNLDQLQSYVKISVSECQKDCKSQAEIANFFSKGPSLQVYYAGLKIKTHLNLAKPADTFPMNTFCNINNILNVEEDLYFAPAIIDLRQTFLSILESDAVPSRIFDSSFLAKQDRRYTPKDQQDLCTFNLRYSSDSKYYFAIDQSIILLVLSSISQASGLATAIIGFLKIIYKIYATHNTFEIIMKHVFKFDQGLPIDNEIFNKLNPLRCSFTKRLGQLYLKDVSTKDQQFEFWDNIRIRCYMFFAQFNFTKSFCERLKNEKLEAYLPYMAQQKIIKDLDLANIVQKLYEIDFLKLYLFDDQQLLLFNSFCYPVLNDQAKEDYELKRLTPVNDQYSGDQRIVLIEDRLSKYSRFFNAQLRFSTLQELSNAYHKLKTTNQGAGNQQSQKLIEFTHHNQTLINAIDIMIENRESSKDEVLEDDPQEQQIQNVREMKTKKYQSKYINYEKKKALNEDEIN